jgi:ABC-type transport system substrate-binding protein
VIPALRRGLLTGLVVAGLLAAGCSKGGGGESGAGRPASGSSSSSAGTGVTSPATTPSFEGTVRVGLAGPLVIDPVRASPAVPSDQMVLDLLHDGLTRVDADGRVRAGLAQGWTADSSSKVWHFTLDPAATFASGRPVTATDVVSSLQRVIAAGDTSLAALRLEPVVGFRAFLDGTAPNVAGLVAVDARTVQITLDTPLSVLPEVLAAPAYGVVDVASLGAALRGDVSHLDLSGGWQVASASGGKVVLRHRPTAAGHLGSVELRSYKDAAAAYAAFGKGQVDWAPVPTNELGAAKKAYGGDHIAPFQAELALGLRVSSLPDLGLRQAIAAAIDRSAIVKAVYPDLADPLSTVVPVGVVGHDEGRCPTCAHDLARAKALIAQTYPDGQVPPVSIDYDASPAQQAMAGIVAQNLLDAGIPTSLRPLPLAEYQHLLVSGAQELFTLSWIGADRTADAYLDPLFRSSSPDNLVGLRSADVDIRLGQARAAPDPGPFWAEAERVVLEQAVVVPIAQFRTQVVVGKRVHGLAHAVDGTVDWAAVSVTGSP